MYYPFVINIQGQKTLRGMPSVLLDVLRISAALVVFVLHSYYEWFPEARPKNNELDLSHTAVVVFFVLSGYVIAYTTTSNDRGPAQYAVARLSRLFSIVIPALIITAIVELFLKLHQPLLHLQYSRDHTIVRYIICSLFLNELWFSSSAPLMNVPLWSLSFEFWYYTIFGCWFYSRQKSWTLLLPILACFVAGPKILVLMPVWFFGYLAYRLPLPVLKIPILLVLLVVCITTTVFIVAKMPAYPAVIGTKPLLWASQFFTDWLAGIGIASFLWLLPLLNYFKVEKKFLVYMRKIGDFTFPLYVLHLPLIILCKSTLVYQFNNVTQLLLVIFTVLSLAILLGILFEKQRFLWVRIFNWLFLIDNLKC